MEFTIFNSLACRPNLIGIYWLANCKTAYYRYTNIEKTFKPY